MLNNQCVIYHQQRRRRVARRDFDLAFAHALAGAGGVIAAAQRPFAFAVVNFYACLRRYFKTEIGTVLVTQVIFFVIVFFYDS